MAYLFYTYFEIFSKFLKSIGHTDLLKLKLKLSSSYPVRVLPFPIPQAHLEEAKR